jgi:hypothetical protein
MERNSFSFLKQFLDAVDTEDLTYEEKCHAVYTLCYYAIRGEYPATAAGMDKMYVRANEKLLEGQDEYRSKKSAEGANGGVKGAKITDEQIRAAYVELYRIKGGPPSEQEVIAKCGGGVQRIGARKVWAEDKSKWVQELPQNCIDNKDVYTHTTDIQNPYKDIHTYTSEDF